MRGHEPPMASAYIEQQPRARGEADPVRDGPWRAVDPGKPEVERRERHGSIYDKLDSLNQFEREVVLIRVANEVEDYLDLGVPFCGTKKRIQAGFHGSGENIVGDIAQKLGFPELAVIGKAEFEKTAIASEQPRFGSIGSRDFSFLAPPLSYKRLMEILAKRFNETPKRRKD